MPFTFFDHTGDVGAHLTARTLNELFGEAAAAFTETVTDPSQIETRRSIPVALESAAVDLLFVDWLSEILYHFDVDQFLVRAVNVDVRPGQPGGAGAPTLQATLLGEPFDAGRHTIKLLIKGVTYHALEVRQAADGWHGTVVFDI